MSLLFSAELPILRNLKSRCLGNLFFHLHLIAGAALLVAMFSAKAQAFESPPIKSIEGLLVSYQFSRATDSVVPDVSGIEPRLDLVIPEKNRDGVKKLEDGLQLIKPVTIKTAGPALKITQAVRGTGELTVEVWCRPDKLDQEGPARVVSISKNTSQRNMTVGQENKEWDVRLRSTKTSTNGIPSLASKKGSVKQDRTHLVYVRDHNGKARLYQNGELIGSQDVKGTLENWDLTSPLIIANELTGDRPWIGTLYAVSIASRAWSADEAKQAFELGPEGEFETPEELVRKKSGQLFAKEIAAIFADRCLECHDAGHAEGKLNLARRELALAGGESGKLVDEKSPRESLIWDQISSDAMPHDRAPLTKEQKEKIAEWLDTGGVWSLAEIDPVNYRHGGKVEGPGIRRLTVDEYVAAVQMATGVTLTSEEIETIPADLRADGFSNTAYNLNVELAHVEAFAVLAEKIVSRMDVDSFAKRFSKSRKLTDDSMRGLIESMGRWVYRGPLSDLEVASLRGISTTVASYGGDYTEAVRMILQAMLQSPRFLYRIESQSRTSSLPVSQFELATRISFLIWGTPPDSKLFDLASQNQLDSNALDSEVQRLLSDERAIEQSNRFLEEWLHLSRLTRLAPSEEYAPDWNPQLGPQMREETIRCWQELVWKEQRPMTDLFKIKYTYLTPELARHYGIDPLSDQQPGMFRRYDLSNYPERQGLITQASLLTVGGEKASMVTRGLFVLQNVLRGVVKDPPPGVDTTPVPPKSGQTHRDVAEIRIENGACGGCHEKFEPLAFGIERFDGLGRYRLKDEFGNSLREEGSVLVPGQSEAISYDTVAKLSGILGDSSRTAKTLTWKLTQFAVGRPLGADDVADLERIHAEASAGGGTYQATIAAIIKSPLIQNSIQE